MTNTRVALAFVAVALICCLPVLTIAHLPLIDLPNHMALQYIATNPQSVLRDYYTYDFAWNGNSAVEALWIGFGHHLTDVESFARGVLAVSIVNFLAALMVLGRVLRGEWSLWPLLGGLLVYNQNFMMGFLNYTVAAPFIIHGFTLWLVLEPRSTWRRILIFLPVPILIYLMHVLALLGLLIVVFGREIQRLILAKGRMGAHLVQNLPLALAFVVPVGLALAEQMGAPDALYDVGGTRFSPLIDRYAPFLSLATAAVQPSGEAVAAALLSSSLLALVVLALRRQGARLGVDPRVVGPVIALLVVAVISPVQLSSVAFFDIRYPYIAFGLLIAGSRPVAFSRLIGTAALVVLVGLGVVRMALMDANFRRYSHDVDDFIALVDQMPAGSRLLAVRDGAMYDSSTFWHLQAYAVFTQEVFVPTLFQGVHGLQVRPEWADYASISQHVSAPSGYVLRNTSPDLSAEKPDRNIYLHAWWDKFTYLVSFDAVDPEIIAKYPLTLTKSLGRFDLYAVAPLAR